jgi:hypothetical protein
VQGSCQRIDVPLHSSSAEATEIMQSSKEFYKLLVKQIHVNNPFFPRLLPWRRNMLHNFLQRSTAATMAPWGLASPGLVKKEIHIVIKPKKARGYVQNLEPDKVMKLAS